MVRPAVGEGLTNVLPLVAASRSSWRQFLTKVTAASTRRSMRERPSSADAVARSPSLTMPLLDISDTDARLPVLAGRKAIAQSSTFLGSPGFMS